MSPSGYNSRVTNTTITPDLPPNVPPHCRKNVQMVKKDGVFGTTYSYDREDGLRGLFCIHSTGHIHIFPQGIPAKNTSKRTTGVCKKIRARNLHTLEKKTIKKKNPEDQTPEVTTPIEVQEVVEVVQEKVQEIQNVPPIPIFQALPPIPLYQASEKLPEKKKIQEAPATSFFLNKFPPEWRGGVERERDQGELDTLGIVYKCKKTKGWLRCRFIILHDGQVVNLGVMASGKSKHAQEVNALPSREETQEKIQKFLEEPELSEAPVKRGPGRPKIVRQIDHDPANPPVKRRVGRPTKVETIRRFRAAEGAEKELRKSQQVASAPQTAQVPFIFLRPAIELKQEKVALPPFPITPISSLPPKQIQEKVQEKTEKIISAKPPIPEKRRDMDFPDEEELAREEGLLGGLNDPDDEAPDRECDDEEHEPLTSKTGVDYETGINTTTTYLREMGQYELLTRVEEKILGNTIQLLVVKEREILKGILGGTMQFHTSEKIEKFIESIRLLIIELPETGKGGDFIKERSEILLKKIHNEEVKLLIGEEERKHLRELKRDADKVIKVFITSNLRLVVSIAKDHMGQGLTLQDLIQEGNIGLMKAPKKYNPLKGNKFSTYATWWIRQAITRAILDKTRTIRLPVHELENVSQLLKAKARLSKELGRYPTYEELSQKLDLPVEKIMKRLEMLNQINVSELDRPALDGDSTMGEFIENEKVAQPGEKVEKDNLAEKLYSEFLSRLTPRQERVIRLRFGIGEKQEYTLDEIGAMKEFDVSRERIRQIEKKAMKRLQFFATQKRPDKKSFDKEDFIDL